MAFQSATHVYDAQGMQINFTDSRQTVGGSPNHLTVQPAIEIAQSYDPDGRPAKRLETRRSEELIGSGPNTNITESVVTTYYIYSSVLGAKVVELDENGQKITGYVYANGTRLAKQSIQGAASSVTWHHANPGSNSWVETDTGRNAGRQEMDPDGAEVGLSDPYVAPEPPTYENVKGNEPLYIEGGDPFDYVTGYTLNGMPMTRGELGRLLGNLGPAGLSRLLLSPVATAYTLPKDLLGDVLLLDEGELSEFPSRDIYPSFGSAPALPLQNQTNGATTPQKSDKHHEPLTLEQRLTANLQQT